MNQTFWHVDIGNLLIIATILGTFFRIYGTFKVMSSRVDEMWGWFMNRTKNPNRRHDD